MFKNKIIRFGTIAILLAIGAYFLIETFVPQKAAGIEYTEDLNPTTYTGLLLEDRRDSQKWFRTSDDSPVQDQENFKGLEFFDPDLAFRVVADVVPYSESDKILEITNTDGTIETYERYAYLHFKINNADQKLLLLKHDGLLSLMWKDGTSGKTTYGGGRYLDFTLSDVKGKQLVVDFNKAYNPYCAYTPEYACPLPPAENSLSESILAGEKYTPEK